MAGTEIENLYSRQELFASIGKTGQARLAAGRAVIVGTGGLGSWVSELLVRCGVGYVRFIDDDRVDYTNLPRQAMFTRDNASDRDLKVTAAYERLAEINPDVVLEPLDARVETDTAHTLLSGFDVIIDATDSWAARFVINDFAVEKNIRWVFAGVVQAAGQVMAIVPHKTACLRCVYESAPDEATEQANRASAVGVLGPAVAAVAAIEATVAVRLLLGDDDVPGLTHFDIWNMTARTMNTKKPSKDCRYCSK